MINEWMINNERVIDGADGPIVDVGHIYIYTYLFFVFYFFRLYMSTRNLASIYIYRVV